MKRLLLFGLGLLALAIVAGRASADSDTFEGVSFHPFTMAPAGEGCPPSSHTYAGLQLRDCDPVNLLFDGVALWQVAGMLRDSGWTAIGLGSYQLLHLARTEVPVGQTAAMYLSVAAGSEGCPAEGPGCRFHVRLWATGWRSVVGAVHFETAGLLGPHQLLQSWEFAESRVCNDLAAQGSLTCAPNSAFLATQAAIQAGGNWRGLANDANASVISRSLVARFPMAPVRGDLQRGP